MQREVHADAQHFNHDFWMLLWHWIGNGTLPFFSILATNIMQRRFDWQALKTVLAFTTSYQHSWSNKSIQETLGKSYCIQKVTFQKCPEGFNVFQQNSLTIVYLPTYLLFQCINSYMVWWMVLQNVHFFTFENAELPLSVKVDTASNFLGT